MSSIIFTKKNFFCSGAQKASGIQNGQNGRTQGTGIVSECRRGKTAVFKNGRAGSGSDVSRNRGKVFAAVGHRDF